MERFKSVISQKMSVEFYLWTLSLFIYCHCVTLSEDKSIVDQKLNDVVDDCDPSTIPVMASFDMKEFSGKWFELAKTTAGYLDVSDGAWKIEANNGSHKFLFSGRDNNQHCIRPIRGKIDAEGELPGLLSLKYQTYSTYVEESIRVLFTDYKTVAVVYTCMYHVHHPGGAEACHAAGILGAVWTREPHVQSDVHEKALAYLEKACVHRTAVHVRNLVGPCRVDDLEFRIDDFPAPEYCYQPADLGSCRGSLERFHYEPKEKACKTFLYGGCGGNKNNFMSRMECEQKCIASSIQDPVCMSVAKCGLHCSPCCTEDNNGCVECNCEYIVEDKFFNCMKSTSMCPDECEVAHIYPGCNVCKCDAETKLEDPSTSVCDEVMKQGNCNDNIERFFYNAVTDQCKPFQFSGCNGNRNNFPTYQECKEACQISDQELTVLLGPVKEYNSAQSNQYEGWTFSILIILIFFTL